MLKKERKETAKKYTIRTVFSIIAFVISIFLLKIICFSDNVIWTNQHIFTAIVAFILIMIAIVSVAVSCYFSDKLISIIIRSVDTWRISKKLNNEFKHVKIKASNHFDSHQIIILHREDYKAEAKMDENEAITLRITNKHGEVFNDIIDLYELKNNYIL